MPKDLATLQHAIPRNMVWLGPADAQFEAFREVERRINTLAAPYVVDTHHSKSINLPVMRVRLGDAAVTWLDNFHELDIHYKGPSVALTYEECGYVPFTAERYREEMAKCEGYSWRGWSEEEIRDERITRVKALTNSGADTYWNERRPEAKKRWLRRFVSAEWYTLDWVSGALLGDVAALLAGETPCLWQRTRAFDNDTGPYAPDATAFSLVFPTGTVLERVGLIRKLLGEVTHG